MRDSTQNSAKVYSAKAYSAKAYSAKILAVDDVPANLEVITEILATAQYTTATAISGDRALKRLKTYQPDLILLDIQMPGIDGFETCAQIKANPKTAHIPIIFITALSDVKSIVKGFELGAVDYISKPFQTLELLARVQTHLQLQSLTQCLEQQVEARTAELQRTLEELHVSKLQQMQAEKMATLGSLMAGVAHEISNPIGFIGGSIHNAEDYMKALVAHINLYQDEYPSPTKNIIEDGEEISLDFLCEDLPKMLTSMKAATHRIEAISASIRTFSRTDTEHKTGADLRECLDGTLLILKYRLKGNEHRPAIKVVRDYSTLPLYECFAGQLCQVFMNVLANAIDAFDEVAQTSSFRALEENPQVITIQTAELAEQNAIEICIHDNGKGMPENVRDRAFEKLFTTKEVGVGTGLGLAIAHEIVTQKHGGELTLISELDKGTTFSIRLPQSMATVD